MGLYYYYCTLRYSGRIIKLRKLDFGGLKRQFDLKKCYFRGLIAKIGYSYGPNKRGALINGGSVMKFRNINGDGGKEVFKSSLLHK